MVGTATSNTIRVAQSFQKLVDPGYTLTGNTAVLMVISLWIDILHIHDLKFIN